MIRKLLLVAGLTLAFSASNVRAQAPKAEEKKAANAEKKDAKADAKDVKKDAKADAKDAKKDAGGAPAGAGAGAPPKMEAAKPGPETAALKPFTTNATWTGVMKAGAMGPGSPEMPTKGKVKCSWIMGGLWAMCDIEDGPAAPKSFVWKGHWIIGWDAEAKEYRASIFDNMATTTSMKGKIDGTKLIMESPEQMMMGQPMKVRLTWDATDPKAIKFIEERSTKGGPWTVGAESTYKSSK
jgi:hypothetical protein